MGFISMFGLGDFCWWLKVFNCFVEGDWIGMDGKCGVIDVVEFFCICIDMY